ncbi:MAG: FtsL-like putative cell division protein [Bacteroidetes bacterium]|nr:FtsL-like putative cell division protein [Bacteroidota bacterium]
MNDITGRKNTLLEKKEPKKDKHGNSKRAIGKTAHSILDGTFLTRESMIRQLPFLLYLAFLAIIYITNSVYAEKNVIETDRLRKEMKELRYNYITTKSQLMFISKQSEVSKRIKPTGLKEATKPAFKLIEGKGK